MVKSQRASEILADQLPVWRERRNGISAQQLADRITKLGGKLGRVAISEIENRRRRVSLDEALLLAAALNVPPPILFFPFEAGEHVAITPKSEIHPDLATRWLAGESWLASTDRTAIGTHEFAEARWIDAARPLRMHDAHREAQRLAHAAQRQVWRSEAAKDRKGKRDAQYRFDDRLRELAKVRRDMRAESVKPPKLDRSWSEELKRLGEEG